MACYVKLCFFTEVICCQRISGTSKRNKHKHGSEGDDVFMAESHDEPMADTSITPDTEQWSLFEVLTPLAERIIQDSVSAQ